MLTSLEMNFTNSAYSCNKTIRLVANFWVLKRIKYGLLEMKLTLWKLYLYFQKLKIRVDVSIWMHLRYSHFHFSSTKENKSVELHTQMLLQTFRCPLGVTWKCQLLCLNMHHLGHLPLKIIKVQMGSNLLAT